ncbi:hypothetical protein XBLMG947_3131 [Xanthomonas bromi]|uniref:Uncharacterized protein n=3 Tax=Xanthomonas bromi TaxID=56449 RepID=A0A1C3NPK4_9XANT|nr:hypothetical protein XBLMG947_3131 [Xanthomonas bromi]
MYLCKSLGSGNFLANGNIDAWARGMLEVKKIYEAEVQPLLKTGDETEPLTRPDFQAFVGRPPSGKLLEPLSKEEQIALDMTHGIPLIKGMLSAEVEGKPRSGESDFILDTGSTRSIIS